MRVHRLEMTAFGPFAATQVVDFEPLNAAGVFLLTGHTGAGKTSVLDAICFALYGQVPGDRDRAKAYRSDHAPPGVPPRVLLEVSVQGRCFRFTRQAPWSRPSRRAKSGYVDEKARATAEEFVAGTWIARSTRVDEVGHLVSALFGLNREQFCQVVLLPQGDFSAFLRAAAQDRRRILESLFATQRFQAVERWLVEHRRLQARICRDQEETLGRVIARLQEVCNGLLPDAATTARDFEPLLAALDRLLLDARSTLSEASVAAARSRKAAKHARHALDEARALAERQARHQQALQKLATLRATNDVVADMEAAVRRAHAAAPLLPLIDLCCEAVAESERTAAELQTALSTGSRFPDLIGPSGETPAVEVVEARAGALADRRVRLEGLRDAERQCDELADRLAELSAARDRLAALINDLDERIAGDPGALAAARTELAAAQRAAADRESARRLVEKCERALLAAREVGHHSNALVDLEARRLRAREAAATATERWLDARERYLAGIAAELASSLSAGDPCPVCGSSAHPRPATPTPGHVSRRQEEDLLAATTRARRVVDELDDEIAEIGSARAVAVTAAGGLDVAAAEAALAAAKQKDEAAARAAAARRLCEERTAELETAAEKRRTSRQEAGSELAAVTERAAECGRRLTTERARLAAEIEAGERVEQALRAVEAEERSCHILLDALRAHQVARANARRARSRLRAALGRSEFETGQDAVSASMPAHELANAEALVRSHAAELAAVERTLADAVLVAAAAEAAPDLDQLEQAADRAAEFSAKAAAAESEQERRLQRLEVLVADYSAGVEQLGPLREAKRLADDVAGLCTGTSADNPTRTALSHYVLSARLSQVVEAANSRLTSICGGRYRLVHRGAEVSGDPKGGLSLLVSDLHTDRLRDPATLSGGETFYVSLSLALGLADVVSHEAGGAELSTLFVDEGFGSLDDETRDEVLDELDALRTGGRTIGLVSHLAELRARFPAQVRVVATPHGSECLSAANGDAKWTSEKR